MEELVLTIDCGTQSLRAILFSLDGSVVDKEKVEYNPYYSIKPGWAEQNAELYWESLCKACKTIQAREPEKFKRIKGVGVTALRNSMVNLDADGNPLRPIMVWLDQRKAKPIYKPPILTNLALKIVGKDQTILDMQKEGKCNWIRQNQADIWANTHKYVQVSGFLNHRLTGQFNDSLASQIGFIPFDYKRLKWSTTKLPFAFSGKIYPVEPEKLPRLVEPGDIIGRITDNASIQTGIPVGVKVVACGSDKGCETLGMGVLDGSMASLSLGTTATIQTTTSDYLEPSPYMPPYPAVIPGKFNPEIEIFRGYWMITWFKQEFAYKEIQMATLKGIPAEELMNEMLKKVPAGSDGLLVQPYWSPGLAEPLAKGAIIGFGDVHTKAHVYKSIIEGLAFALLEGKNQLEKRGKLKFKKITVSGGASQSDEICQITADVFNLPIVRGKTFENSGLGAAILVAKGLGLYDSIGQVVEKMVSHEQIFYPQKENVEIYQSLFKKGYSKMYRALKPIYKEISNDPTK